jgi:hypothetical protein
VRVLDTEKKMSPKKLAPPRALVAAVSAPATRLTSITTHRKLKRDANGTLLEREGCYKWCAKARHSKGRKSLDHPNNTKQG